MPNSTFPITPYSWKYLQDLEAAKAGGTNPTQLTPYAPEVSADAVPYAPDYFNQTAPLAGREMDKRRDLKAKLLQKKPANPGLDETLPKKFAGKNDSVSQVPGVMPSSKPKKSSRIQDVTDSLGAASPVQSGGMENPFFAKEVPGLSLTMPQMATNTMAPTMGMPGQSSSQPSLSQSLNGQPSLPSPVVTGTVPNVEKPAPTMTAPSEDPREGLKARLLGKNDDMLDRLGQARDLNAMNQLAPILAQASSKMGTLQGKRSDVVDFQPYLKALGERNIGSVMDEQRLQDEDLQRQLRKAQVLAAMARAQKQASPSAPKVLPYYRPATKEQPGEILMYDNNGQLIPQQLPPGYEPNNPWATLPPFINPQGQPIFMQQNPVTGETRQLELPNDLKLLGQIKDETNAKLKKIDLDMKVASEAQKNELLRERMRLSTQMGKIREKEFTLKEQQLAEKKRANVAREGMAGKRGALSPEGAKQLKPSDLGKLSEGRNMPALVNNFRTEMGKFKDLFGPMQGRIMDKNVYNARAQQFNSVIKLTAQSVGKFLEGGKLTDADVPKYERMLPNLSDLPEVAEYKIDQVDRLVRERHENDLRALRAQGYDTTGLEAPPSVKQALKPATSLPQQTKGKKIQRKFHDKANNKTKFIYEDGTSEVVNGLQ